MRYEPIRDYELESIKREIAKALSSGSSSSQSASDAKRNIESAIQDLKRALSSLERNTDSRIRELQSTSSSRSSYSSYESGIRDGRREADRAVSKIGDQLRNLSDGRGYGYGYSSGGDASRKLDTLINALKKANSELQAASRQIDELSKENKELKRKVGGLGSDMVKVAAGAALATASRQQEIQEVRRDRERAIARLKRDYEHEIKALQQDISLKASENAALAAKIAARDNLDEDNWEPIETGLTIAEDYAVLWNDVLEDDVIELREVRHIQKWLTKNKLEAPEAAELKQCCETIIARGEVLDTDVQRLYDCSFRLLGSLGAKLE